MANHAATGSLPVDPNHNSLASQISPPLPTPAATVTTSSTPTTKPPTKRARSSIAAAGAARQTPSVMKPATAAAGDLSKVRAFAACRACRQKKIKCLPGPPSANGGHSACQQCTQSGTDCEYQPTRDRAAYSRAYVQDLSGRVQALEAMHARLLPLLNMFEGGRISGANLGRELGLGNHRNGDASALPSAAPSVAHSPRSPRSDDAEDESQFIMTDERGHYRYIGSSNTLALLDSFPGAGQDTQQAPGQRRVSSPSENNHMYFGPVAGAGSLRAFPGLEEANFPPRAEAERMVDAYFVEVHPVLPVVIEPDFRRDFATLMDKVESRDFAGLSGGFMSVVFAVFALGERILVAGAAYRREGCKLRDGKADDNTTLPGEAEAGVMWFERSQVLHWSTIREIDIHQVQCLTLQASFQAAVNAMPMAWLLASQALRIAVDIGLHRSAPRFKVSYAIKQLGARCWWAIYGLERLISISLGRPLGIDDHDIDVSYPIDVDDSALHSLGDALPEDVGMLPEPSANSTMSGFIALSKLTKIAGRVAQVLYRPSNGKSVNDPSWAASQQRTYERLDRHLREWLENEVPKKYKDQSTSRSVSVMSAVLSNAYFSVLLSLHRNFLPSSPDFPRPRPMASSQSLAQCVEAARSVIHVAAESRVMVPVSHHLALFCQFLWSSAVILLLFEVQATDQQVLDAVNAQVESCRSSLRTLEPAWPGCRKLRELLTDVEGRAREVKAAAATASQQQRPTKRQRSTSANNEANSAIRAKRPSLASSSSSSNLPGEWTKGAPETTFETSDGRSRPTYRSGPATGHVNNGHNDRQAAITNALAMPAMPAFDLFDVGDMNFDGLEMLSAFTSADAWTADPSSLSHAAAMAAAAANNAGNMNREPLRSPAAARISFNTPSATTELTPTPGIPTPQGVGATTTPSPTVSTGGAPNAGTWFNGSVMAGGHVQNQNQHGQPVVELSDMWSQIAGTSFDWEADPSVPFHI